MTLSSLPTGPARVEEEARAQLRHAQALPTDKEISDALIERTVNGVEAVVSAAERERLQRGIADFLERYPE